MKRVTWLLLKFSILFLTGVYLSGFAMFMDRFKELVPVDVLFPFEIWLVWNLSFLLLGWAGWVAVQIIILGLVGDKVVDWYFW